MKYPLLFLFLLFPLTLLTGSVNLSYSDLTEALLRSEEANETALYIVWESRLPQALTAALAGCALAVSGLIMQTLFTNPLADPSLLGIHSGASLGAALAMLALGGWGSIGSFTLSGTLFTIVASFLGACGVIMLLLTFSRLLKGNLALLVTGVMLSFALSAVISLLSFYATADGVRSYIIWGLGDFSGVPLSRMSIFSAFILLPSLLIWMLARPLNALLLGSEYAYNLGVRVETVRTGLRPDGTADSHRHGFLRSDFVYRTGGSSHRPPFTSHCGSSQTHSCNIIVGRRHRLTFSLAHSLTR